MDFDKLFDSTFGEALKLLQAPRWAVEDFCHYTNLQGLFGIVENNEIWLSDHRFLNDQMEYTYGRQLSVDTITRVMASESDTKFKEFLNKLLECIIRPTYPGIFVGSMSFSPDRLDQWKGYGNSRESVCIVFKGDFDLWNTGNSHPTHIRQQQVIYRQTDQVGLVEAIINIYRRQFNEIQGFTFPFLEDLAWLVESQFILFKHEQYSSENEVRLIIDNLQHILKSKKPKHRICNGMIVPYITTKYISVDDNPKLNQLPIKKIIVSPTSHPDLISSIETFIANMGYKDVQVEPSGIKFRGQIS